MILNIYRFLCFIFGEIILYGIIINLFFEKSTIFENRMCIYNYININTKI